MQQNYQTMSDLEPEDLVETGQPEQPLPPKTTPSLWQRAKNQLDSAAVTPNFYDFIAPLWQASAIFSCMIYGAWLHDGCPLDVEHQSDLSYGKTQEVAIAVALISYFTSLACRFIEKHYKLQPMQDYVNYLSGKSKDEGNYKRFNTEHPLTAFVLVDELQYRFASALLGWVASLSFYAICTVEDTNKDRYWDGCWQLEPLKIISCIGALLAGLLTENPLSQKRRELQIEINARSPGPSLNG